MADRRAFVYVDSDGEYRVYPGVVVLEDPFGPADKFKLINMTGVEFDVEIPAGAFGQGPVKEKLKGKGNQGDKIGPLKPETGGAYSYVVKDAKGKKAKGNSDPVIIIDM